MVKTRKVSGRKRGSRKMRKGTRKMRGGDVEGPTIQDQINFLKKQNPNLNWSDNAYAIALEIYLQTQRYIKECHMSHGKPIELSKNYSKEGIDEIIKVLQSEIDKKYGKSNNNGEKTYIQRLTNSAKSLTNFAKSSGKRLGAYTGLLEILPRDKTIKILLTLRDHGKITDIKQCKQGAFSRRLKELFKIPDYVENKAEIMSTKKKIQEIPIIDENGQKRPLTEEDIAKIIEKVKYIHIYFNEMDLLKNLELLQKNYKIQGTKQSITLNRIIQDVIFLEESLREERRKKEQDQEDNE